jgi:hypothetical protein
MKLVSLPALVTGAIAINSLSQIGCCHAESPFLPKSTVFSKPQTFKRVHDVYNSVLKIPRGGEVAAASASSSSSGVVSTLLTGLCDFMSGAKSDTIALLSTTALVAPICKQLGISNILGFLAAGMALGPNGIKGGLISDVHRTELLADLGIVFFLFEMGLHINFDTLMSMKNDVFGLGLAQVLLTASAVAGIASLCGMSTAAMVVLGGGISLSSSAFVLQLLKDKKQLDTRHGKSSLGVLIMQDLAVVPLLVVTPLLAGGGDGWGGISDGNFCSRYLCQVYFRSIVRCSCVSPQPRGIRWTHFGYSVGHVILN